MVQQDKKFNIGILLNDLQKLYFRLGKLASWNTAVNNFGFKQKGYNKASPS